MKLIFTTFCVILFTIQKTNARLRLIGVTPPNSDPNIVAIIFNRNGENICSGAIIHPLWIVTTATCAIRTYDEERRVNFGNKVNLNFNDASYIKNTYINPKFNGWELNNDIALIQLVQRIPTYVRTLKLSNDDGNIIGTKAYVLGYGDDEDTAADGTLREKKVNILNNDVCNQYPVNINYQKLCTYQSRACEGDQGGPLVSSDKKTLLGLISITEDQASMCGGNVIIPVTTYTRISSYINWIKNTTQINYL